MNGRAKAFSLLLGILPASVLVMHGYLGSYTRLIADDFCSVYFAEKLGLLRSIWFWRLNWSGRYSAFAIDWVLAKLAPVYSLPFVTSISLILWCLFAMLTIFLALRSLKPESWNWVVAFLTGLLFVFVVLSLSPNLPQSLYWWNGMRSYTLPLIGLTLAFMVFQARPAKFVSNFNGLLWGVGSFILLFLNGGLGETFAVFQFSALVFLIALRLVSSPIKREDTGLLLYAAGLLGTVISLVVIISAPGNAIRQAFNPPPEFGKLVGISIQAYLDFLSLILFSPEKITGLAGAILLLILLGGFYADAIHKGWQIAAYVGGGILLSFACFPPGVYGYSEPPPLRTLVIACFGLVAGLFCASFLVGQRLSKVIQSRNVVYFGVTSISVLLLGVSSIIQMQMLYQQRTDYIAYAQAWDRNDRMIWEAKTAQKASVIIENPAANNWTGLNVLNDNPKFWVNACHTNYYGIPVFGPKPDEDQP
jgi:hypothetical protein